MSIPQRRARLQDYLLSLMQRKETNAALRLISSAPTSIKVDLIFLTLFLIIDHFFTVTIVYIHIVVYVCVVVYNVCSIVVVVFSYFIVIMFSCMVKSCNNHHSAVGFTGRCCRWSVRGGGARGHNTSVRAPRACPPRGRAGGSGGTANKRAQNALIHWQQKFGGEKTYECRAGP